MFSKINIHFITCLIAVLLFGCKTETDSSKQSSSGRVEANGNYTLSGQETFYAITGDTLAVLISNQTGDLEISAIQLVDGLCLIPFKMAKKSYWISCASLDFGNTIFTESNLMEKYLAGLWGLEVVGLIDTLQNHQGNPASNPFERYSLLNDFTLFTQDNPPIYLPDTNWIGQSVDGLFWSCEQRNCKAYMDLRLFNTNGEWLEDKAFKQFINLQFAYFPIDSIEIGYSSHYLIDGSKIYSTLGDMRYFNRLQALDILDNQTLFEYPIISTLWEETMDQLAWDNRPYWNDLNAVLQELDSIQNLEKVQSEQKYAVQLSAYRSLIEQEEHLDFFNHRTGIFDNE